MARKQDVLDEDAPCPLPRSFSALSDRVLLWLLPADPAVSPPGAVTDSSGTVHTPPDPQSVGAGDLPRTPDAASLEQPEDGDGRQDSAPGAIRWQVDSASATVFSDDPAAAGLRPVMLTFDDGPSPATTPMVLDALRAAGVRAVFLVTGAAADHPDLIRRIQAEGHVIGNHTLHHENLTTLSREEQRAQITDLNAIIRSITGETPCYLRPPYGAYDADTEAVAEDLGMTILTWSHGSGDWMDAVNGYKDPQEVVADVLAEVPRSDAMTPLHPGAVVLMHDTLRHTAEALPLVLDGLREMGYVVVAPER